MNKTLKILLIGAGGIGAVYGLSKLLKLKKLDENASIQVLKSNKNPDIVDFDILKLNPGSLRLFIDVIISNPNNINYTITKPYIKVFINNNEIGNSSPDGTTYTIKANATTKIEQIEIKVPLSYLITDAISFVKNYLNTGKIGGKLNKDLIFDTTTKINNVSINKKYTYSI